jgi:hypothetical protein
MSYTAKQLIGAAKKLGFRINERATHTLVIDPTTERRLSTIPRGNIRKGTFNAILKQLGITEAEFKKLA